MADREIVPRSLHNHQLLMRFLGNRLLDLKRVSWGDCRVVRALKN